MNSEARIQEGGRARSTLVWHVALHFQSRFKGIQRQSKPFKGLWKRKLWAGVCATGHPAAVSVQISGLNTIAYYNLFAPMLTYYNHFDPLQFFWADSTGRDAARRHPRSAQRANPTIRTDRRYSQVLYSFVSLYSISVFISIHPWLKGTRYAAFGAMRREIDFRFHHFNS